MENLDFSEKSGFQWEIWILVTNLDFSEKSSWKKIFQGRSLLNLLQQFFFFLIHWSADYWEILSKEGRA